jgi:tetratricopeptide (TPR) repeat protein
VRRIKGDLDGALADVNKSISLDAKNGEAYCNLGLIYLSQGNGSAAKLNFDKCYSLDNELRPKFEKLAHEIKR